MVAEPLSGLAGIAALPFGAEASSNVISGVQDSLTYQPRTNQGKDALQSLGQTLAPVGEAFTGASEFLGDKAFDATGSPTLAAAAYSVPTLALEALGLKGARSFNTGKALEFGDIGTQASRAGGRQRGILGGVKAQKAMAELKRRGVDFDSQIAKEKGIADLAVADIREKWKSGELGKQEAMGQISKANSKLNTLRSRKNMDSFVNRDKSKDAPVIDNRPKGKPFKGVAFHQTSQDFKKFDSKKGADGSTWFTQSEANFSDPKSSSSAASGKGKVIKSNIELKKAAGFDELDRFSIAELVDMGFDGAVLGEDIQVFDSKAIKSFSRVDQASKELKRRGIK